MIRFSTVLAKSELSYLDFLVKLTNWDRMGWQLKMTFLPQKPLKPLISQNLNYSKRRQLQMTIKGSETAMTTYILNHHSKREKKKRSVMRKMSIYSRSYKELRNWNLTPKNMTMSNFSNLKESFALLSVTLTTQLFETTQIINSLICLKPKMMRTSFSRKYSNVGSKKMML